MRMKKSGPAEIVFNVFVSLDRQGDGDVFLSVINTSSYFLHRKGF